MMKANQKSLLDKLFTGSMALVLAATMCVGLTACSDDEDTSDEETTEESTEETEESTEETEESTEETEESTEETEESTEETEETTDAATLTAPSDFTLDPDTGEYSFTANDENMGYYFIRIYQIVGGEEADAYTVSSERISGGTTGEMTGTIDLSGCGWGEYVVKLISFAAAGTDDEAPEAVTIDMFCGVGGVLERPEMMVLTDGSHVEFIIDWYTLSDYLVYQYLPTVEFCVYSDADCTTLVASYEYDLSELEYAIHPTGAYYWEYTTSATYSFIEDSYGLDAEVTIDDLDAGTYYVTVQAISDSDEISSSEVSEVLEFTVTADAASGEYTTVTTSLWADPSVMGMPTAAAGTYTDRIDFGGDQTTTNTIL